MYMYTLSAHTHTCTCRYVPLIYKLILNIESANAFFSDTICTALHQHTLSAFPLKEGN